MNHFKTLADPKAPAKFRLYRIRLNNGGYDDCGRYFGCGSPLYCAEYEGSEAERWQDGFGFELRADSRDEAKAIVRFRYPFATFHR